MEKAAIQTLKAEGRPLQLQFLGCGDAFGSGGRFNTCIHIRDQRGGFLVDCGASSMIAARKFGINPNNVRAILITHLHGDHFGGLPFFILDAQLISRRTLPLTVAGPPGLCDRLATAMEVFFPGSTKVDRRFVLDLRELKAGVTYEVEGVEVTPYLVKHSCGAPPFALRMRVDGKSLCYSGDTEWVDSLHESARDVDLFIVEAYFSEKQVKFHLDLATLSSHLPTIHAKRVVLTHMSAEMLATAGKCTYEMAEDGMVISV